MRKWALILALCFVAAAWAAPETLYAGLDSVSDPVPVLMTDETSTEQPDTLWWWYRLKKGKLDLKDNSVRYPKFIRFCVDVYNWGDTTFNNYDPRYVAGTGKRWKCYVKDDNWLDSYSMHFGRDEHGKEMNMLMASDVTVNVGAYLQYMAVSIGYSFDMSNIIGNKPINYKRFDFGFNCALFTAEAYYTENNGGTYIRKFGAYRPTSHHLPLSLHEYFPGVTMRSAGIDLYYFVNNKRYSQGAAYNFSKIQLRPAGSVIAGFTYSNNNIGLDFTRLPSHLLPFMTAPTIKGKFHYAQYCAMIGYGYNLPFGRNHKFLLNITAIPTVGVIRNYSDSFEGESTMFSMNVKGRVALVYNSGDLFVGLHGRMDGRWYKSKEYSFFSSIETFSLSAGVRF